MKEDTNRCEWARGHDLLRCYHDQEWGVPRHDDRTLFEYLILDGAQAGLSWLTILKKRENYRRALDGFDAQAIANYDDAKIDELMLDEGIVRNRLKIRSAIANARVFLDIQEEFGSFDAYIWRYVEGEPIQNRWRSLKQVPANTELSDTISKDLKKRGMNFVGSTIIYAWMQGIGLVNDHTVDCFRHEQVAQLR